ncbi:hypothetical protein B566_EDAN001945 [Ephemera danica]|nr:hypothetical protein B566_EDAN001945 [Ephemera danica]
MTSIQTAKKLLRSDMKKRLAALSKEQILLESEILTKKFLSHPAYIKSRRIAVYLSMEDEMEMLRLHSLADLNTLAVTKWNVRQPADTDDHREDALTSGGLDLVLVPGMAFTVDGHRMGRGKGYYDTFLQQCRDSQVEPPTTIALALSPQIVSNVPTHDHDMLIDVIISPD